MAMQRVSRGKVEAVTVFRAGAAVTRQISLEGLGADVRELRIAPLPLALDDDSVRLTGEGVEATELHVVLTPVDADPDLPPPEDEALEAARLAEAAAEARVETCVQALAALEKLGLEPRAFPEEGPRGIPMQPRLALVAFRRERQEALHAELRARREAHRKAKEERRALEEAKRRATTARQTRPNELRKGVDVRLAGPPRGTLRLSYRVPGARWVPSYALRFDAALERVVVEARAHVAQRSGEDWADAALTLSTASPEAWTELPDPPAIRIGRRQAAPKRRGWREPPQGADALFADYDRAFPAPSPRSSVVPTTGAAPEPRMELEEESADDDVFADLLEEPRAERPAPKRAKKRGRAREDCAGAPPPPAAPAPAAAPMPPMPLQAPMPAEGRARSSSLFGFGSSGAPGAPAPQAVTMAAEPPPPEPELVAPDDLLAFGRLRLAPPKSAPRRGSLRLAGRAERYRDALVADGRRVDFDLERVLGQAAERARSLATPPPDTLTPETEDGFDYAFPVAHPMDVPSDGAFHGLPLARAEVDARPRFVVVPREADEVFRFVELDNPLEGPLLRGPADVYLDGRYLLTRALRPIGPGERLELGLGVEQAIKIARNTRYREESAGLMGRSLELVHAIEIDVTNHLPGPALVEVRERVPTTREGEDDIEVRVDEVRPAWESWEPPDRALEGGHRWRVRVESGATERLEARYVVRIAGKHELVGGNRRER